MEPASMGVILDSSILIAGERRRDSVAEILERVERACGQTTAAISAITVVELTHDRVPHVSFLRHGFSPI